MTCKNQVLTKQIFLFLFIFHNFSTKENIFQCNSTPFLKYIPFMNYM